MVIQSCCVQNDSITLSEWISILGIVVNSGLAVWIVYTIQKNLTNKRVLKDHFIAEVKEIRTDYTALFKNLGKQEIKPQEIMPWFKSMNIRIKDLMEFLSLKYKIDTHFLFPYRLYLLKLITDNDDYIKCYKSNTELELSSKLLRDLSKFQQDNNHLFNELIVKINDSK